MGHGRRAGKVSADYSKQYACARIEFRNTIKTTHVLACAALMRYTSGFDTTLRSAATTAPDSCSV